MRSWTRAGWTYALPDALGSVRQAVDGSGGVVESREWSPYGVEVGTAQAGLGYTGEWWDAAVGLQYLRARWYDVERGRFTSQDPWEGSIGKPRSLHGYLYADSDPIKWTDPSGRRPGHIDEIGDLREHINSLLDEGTLSVGYQYSCNCGWIDWAHALSGMQRKTSLAYEILKPLEAQIQWDGYPPEVFRDRIVRVRSVVGVKGLIRVPVATDYARVPDSNLSSTALRHAIAAGIFMRHSEHVEEFHYDVGRLSHSGYSEEDLPSNLIGLYMTLQIESGKSYRDALGEVLQLCGVMNKEASQSVYRHIYQNGALFLEGWKRWDARLVPTVMADPCKFSRTCSAPGRWPTQFANLHHRAQWAERQGLWRWLTPQDAGDFVLTDTPNLLLLRPYQVH